MKREGGVECAADIERVARIRRLQDLLGHDLDEILAEATEINHELRAQVKARLAALSDFAAELEDTAKRYRKVARELRPTTSRR